jgi:hypothetical protein
MRTYRSSQRTFCSPQLIVSITEPNGHVDDHPETSNVTACNSVSESIQSPISPKRNTTVSHNQPPRPGYVGGCWVRTDSTLSRSTATMTNRSMHKRLQSAPRLTTLLAHGAATIYCSSSVPTIDRPNPSALRSGLEASHLPNPTHGIQPNCLSVTPIANPARTFWQLTYRQLPLLDYMPIYGPISRKTPCELACDAALRCNASQARTLPMLPFESTPKSNAPTPNGLQVK